MKNENKGTSTTANLIILLIIFLLICSPILIKLISNNIKNANQAKHEERLLEEGKIKTHNEVMNEIVEILKDKDKEKIKNYSAIDFVYYDNNNIEHKYINSFWDDLSIYITSYEIEERENSTEDKVTYRIYWNVVEENKKKGIDKTNQYYCLQKITIILKRAVKENEITYEIEKIILTNN
nr:MAG TPA: hypothetical protein [Caudoviricetes sp.]